MSYDWPQLSDIRATQELLAPHLVRTPTVRWDPPMLARLLGNESELWSGAARKRVIRPGPGGWACTLASTALSNRVLPMPRIP